MRIANEDIIHELKMRLENERSLKKKVLLKKMLEIMNDLY